MEINVKNFKEFLTEEEAIEFALTYKDYVNTSIQYEQQILIGSIQSHSLTLSLEQDKKYIDAIAECLKKVEPTSIDIILYRCGELHPENRPYVSATLLKKTTKKYKKNKYINFNNLHKIYVPKGSKIFPLRALGEDFGDGEAEIIISTKCIQKISGKYIYIQD